MNCFSSVKGNRSKSLPHTHTHYNIYMLYAGSYTIEIAQMG